MEIKFEIVSRGAMRIHYGKRVAMIAGELTFEPPVFYADMVSFKNWEPPYEHETITENQIDEMVEFLINSGSSTKILFE